MIDMPEIERATALRLEPGDVLVLTCPDALDSDEMEHIKAVTEETFPGVKCLILAAGLDLAEVQRSPTD